jgi:hypothetical protein
LLWLTENVPFQIQELCQKDRLLEDQRRIIVEIQIRLDEKQKELESLRHSLESHQTTIINIESDNRVLNEKLHEAEEKRDKSVKVVQNLVSKNKELQSQMQHVEEKMKSLTADQIGEMHQEENEVRMRPDEAHVLDGKDLLKFRLEKAFWLVAMFERPDWASGNPLRILRDKRLAFGPGMNKAERENLLADIVDAQVILKNDDLKHWLLSFFEAAHGVVSSFRSGECRPAPETHEAFDLVKDKMKMFPSMPLVVMMKRALKCESLKDREFVKCMDKLSGRDYLIALVEIFCLTILDVKHKFCNPEMPSHFDYNKQLNCGNGLSFTDRRDLLNLLDQALTEISYLDNIKTNFISEIKKAHTLISNFRSHPASSSPKKAKAAPPKRKLATDHKKAVPQKRQCYQEDSSCSDDSFGAAGLSFGDSSDELHENDVAMLTETAKAEAAAVAKLRERRYKMMAEKSEALHDEYYVPSANYS